MQNKIWTRLGRMAALIMLAFNLAACDMLNSLRGHRPNIIILLTDDLDFSLMPYLENTNELIADQGATFTNYFATTPLCCPARTSMLTGQYSHNTDILDNYPAFKRFFNRGEESETIAVWLNRAGYETALIGKYLNLYPVGAGQSHIPPGWTDWHAFLYERGGDNFYYDYLMNENGEAVRYGHAPGDYSTDVLLEKSSAFIERSSSNGSPFFLFLAVYAPHGPSTAADRHADLYPEIKSPSSPAIEELDVTDKPAILRSLVQGGDEFDRGDADRVFGQRLRSIQAVDELVADMILLLETNGRLENTYIFFTSDNGFRTGEHGLPAGKGLPYEEDIHLPFMVRGPGIPPGSVFSRMIAGIDLAPTIAEMAGVDTDDLVDGRSILPLLEAGSGELEWRKGLLIEAGYLEAPLSGIQPAAFVNPAYEADLFDYLDATGDETLRQIGGIAYRGFRTETFKYMEYNSGEIELYDLKADPHELENLGPHMDPAILSNLHSWLERLKTCRAQECRSIESDLPQSIGN